MRAYAAFLSLQRGPEIMREESMAEDKPITVEEVRSAQGCLKNGITLHEKKSFKPFLQNFLKNGCEVEIAVIFSSCPIRWHPEPQYMYKAVTVSPVTLLPFQGPCRVLRGLCITCENV